MDFVLEHPAVGYCNPCWAYLLADIKKKEETKHLTFGTFCSRIETLADKIKNGSGSYVNPGMEEKSPEEIANKFKGDVFEVFGELLIRLSSLDDRIGIHDYHPVTENDTGVDGWGLALDGQPATVQFKYRVWDYTLTEDHEHLDNFRLTSYQKYHVSPGDDNKMLIITAGKEVHWKTLNKAFAGRLRVISRKASYSCIRGAQKHTVDQLFSLETITNNVFFWETFRKKVQTQ